MSKNRLIFIAGGLWGVIGLFLIYRGALMYRLAMENQNSTQTAVVISLVVGLLLGAAKGYFVLARTAGKNKSRIQNLTDPVKIHHLFAKSFYLLIAFMITLGILLRTFNAYLGGYVVVAAIYCAIGTALIVSSRIYWKSDAPSPVEENP